MSTTQTRVDIPAGVWAVDPVHSNANFEVEHASVSVFRGGFKPVDATLTVTDAGIELTGSVAVETISVDDENIRPHLLSPEFFDAERNPRIEFASTGVTGDAGDLQVTGELSMAGLTLSVAARGRLRGPVEGPGGIEKASLALEATIDRTAFGMNWQMELPSGGVALANDVKLLVELELNRRP
jgi:polyisoprenoid-binding protein YceI